MTTIHPLRVDGPLNSYTAGFYAFVLALGYTDGSARWQVWVMANLSRWMAQHGITPGELRTVQRDRFLADYRGRHYKTPLGLKRLTPLLQYLRQERIVPEVSVAQATPLQTLLDQYERFLEDRRNLAPRTIDGHLRTAQRFMEAWIAVVGEPWSLESLTARDPRTFLLHETQRLSSGAAKNVLQQLRGFLRFGYQAGFINQDLAITLPPVASWHATRLPPIIPAHTVEEMLASCDRTTALGRRDYAALLLLARLGLRAQEVCRLALEDVNWRTGEITVTGKGRRVDRLPLPADVGTALAEYLQQDRPVADSRRLLLRYRAPHHEMSRAGLAHIVEKACHRCNMPLLGPHRLRHALATTLLQQGVTLPAIGQVLRHRDLQSTAVYAKVDRAALRTAAQPWPEEHS